jgi:uncharacterized membrane protein
MITIKARCAIRASEKYVEFQKDAKFISEFRCLYANESKADEDLMILSARAQLAYKSFVRLTAPNV